MRCEHITGFVVWDGKGLQIKGFINFSKADMVVVPSHFRVYLDPKEPPFLGFLIMISLYKSLKR